MAILSNFDLDSFRGQIKNVMRPYLFYVQIPSFPGLTGASSRMYTYLAQSTSIPARTVSELKTNWQGYEYKLGGVSTWSDWKVTFLLDSEAYGYTNMRNWIDAVHKPETNIHGNPGNGSNGYIRDSILFQQIASDNPNRVIIEFQLIGAWLKDLSEISVGYDKTSEVATYDATFSFIYAKFNK